MSDIRIQFVCRAGMTLWPSKPGKCVRNHLPVLSASHPAAIILHIGEWYGAKCLSQWGCWRNCPACSWHYTWLPVSCVCHSACDLAEAFWESAQRHHGDQRGAEAHTASSPLLTAQTRTQQPQLCCLPGWWGSPEWHRHRALLWQHAHIGWPGCPPHSFTQQWLQWHS